MHQDGTLLFSASSGPATGSSECSPRTKSNTSSFSRNFAANSSTLQMVFLFRMYNLFFAIPHQVTVTMTAIYIFSSPFLFLTKAEGH